jgi:hypothetical protein
MPPDLIGGPSDGPAADVGFGPFNHAMQTTCRGMVLRSTWLPRMVRSREFKVSRTTKEDRGGIKVEFSYEPRNPGSNDYVRSGWIVVDPSRYWLVRNAEVKVRYGPVERGVNVISNEFDDKVMPFPVVTRQVQKESVTDGNRSVVNETVYECELHAVEKDDAQYTLSAFGLPEPFPTPSPWQRWRPIICLIAIAVLTLVLIWRRLQRERPAHTS